MANWLTYVNQGATRNQPLSPALVQAMSFLPSMGLGMTVFSGGQPASGPHRTGSHRHDLGGAGDVFFTRDGRNLDWANQADLPIFQDIVRRAKAAGVTGFGAGPGYMRPGSMHLGFGTPTVWGAGGSGANAPQWLREAYGSVHAAEHERDASLAPPTQQTSFLDILGIPKPQAAAPEYHRPLPFNEGFGMQQFMQGLIGGTLKQDLRAAMFKRVAGLFA